MGSSSEWVISNASGVSTLYVAKSEKRIKGSTRSSDRVIRPEKFLSTKFREKLVLKRKKMLTLMGVKEWKLEKQIWQDRKVLFKGSYRDVDNKVVHFLEVHDYHDTGYTQALLTGTEVKIDEKHKLAKSFFKVLGLKVKW